LPGWVVSRPAGFSLVPAGFLLPVFNLADIVRDGGSLVDVATAFSYHKTFAPLAVFAAAVFFFDPER
jgi:hypothetical protein